MDFQATLSQLAASGNLRRFPSDLEAGAIDFTSNDYLGLGSDAAMREEFFARHSPAELAMTSSASRLLAASQRPYSSLEKALEAAYGRPALMFNSGYHANTGIIPAIASRSDFIVADRLVHASIIDGIKLSGAEFTRFRHNDYDHLEKIIEKKLAEATAPHSIIVIAESIYSMDGDRADIRRLAAIKKRFRDILLYVDEAHAVGVSGPGGLGEVAAQGEAESVDILVGTLGKALASAGAYAITSSVIRDYLINKARPLIFSTAISPAQALWSEFTFAKALAADSLRQKLWQNALLLAEAIPGGEPSHIRPLIVGDATAAVSLSTSLHREGFNVLPIRTPTVPPGTERLRFSLSASHGESDIKALADALKRLTDKQ